ncbi:hypothetical protein NHX12_001094 [Muraenolepis orangiensis]|uniref:C2H2-type domain-containing protein n=1 Tax=Muraenolepis orangiensis TaxID=630683 RepID=A0A9Q0E1F4_9TELE|nr:hypothetical protein NHX12_001094 [Muraenolepis orangiensis]
MYQVPVQRLDRIRTSRKRVKAILTDIGLNSCQDFLKDQKTLDDNGSFEKTEWNDLTDCYQTKKRKKWCYRTQPLCCALCWFSCRSWYTFRSHVQRCHDEESDLASLTPCPTCAYISRPGLLARHAKLFHGSPQAAPSANNGTAAGNRVNRALTKALVSPTQAGVRVTTVGPGGDRYSCAACGFHDSLLYVMRKHVLLNHCKSLLQKYYGRRADTTEADGEAALNADPGGKRPRGLSGHSKFFCCTCKMPAETSEHLLYHLLSSAKHLELQGHIRPLLVEHCSSIAKIAPAGSKSLELPHVAPLALQQVVSMMAKGMVNLPPVNGQHPAPKKTMLLTTHSQPTALVCSAVGGRQQIVLSGGQKAAGGSNKPLGFMVSSGAQGKQVPLTVTVRGSGQGQTQQVLLPAGITLNLGGNIGSVGSPRQPLVFNQSREGKIEVKMTTAGQQMVLTQPGGQATTAGAGTPQPLVSNGKAALGPSVVLAQGKALGPSVVLSPGNANTFSAVAPNRSLLIGGQVGPGQSMMLNQGLSLQSSQSTVRLIPTGNKVNGMPTYTLAAVQVTMPVQSGQVAKPPVVVAVPPQKALVPPAGTLPAKPPAAVSQAMAAKSLYVSKSLSGKLECQRCKVAFADQSLYQHLLHGMHCLLCPLVFYSLRQLRSHCDEAHSLAQPANRQRLQLEYRLACTQEGRLVARLPTLNAKVPKDMLGCKELHLALVPKDRHLEVMHVHLTEKLAKPSWPASPTPPFSCPFCREPCSRSPATYEQHLRQRHHVMHTIHAILKTPAFKCVYCLGVYTEQSSTRTVSIHVQRCRCAPRSVKDAEKLLNPDTSVGAAGRARYWCRLSLLFLVNGLKLSQPEVTSIFSSKRKRCLQDCQRRRLQVLLGFDSCHLKTVQHGLVLTRSPVSRGSVTQGCVNMETQTSVVVCKQEPMDPVEIGPFSDHPYAEPQPLPTTTPSPPTQQNGRLDRTESGKQP